LTHPLDAAQQALGRDQLATLLGRLSRTDRSHVEALSREGTRAEVYGRLVRSVIDAGPERP
jgi:hypothetical protein